MNRRRRQHTFLLIILLLAAFITILVTQTWRQVRQEQVNRQLVLAVKTLDVAEVRDCLRNGADPNIRATIPEPTTLRQLFWNLVGHRQIGTEPITGVPVLIEVEQQSTTNAVAQRRCSDIALLLIRYGASPVRVGTRGEMPDSPILDVPGMGEGATEVAKALLDRGADVNDFSDPGEDSPLYNAAGANDTATALLLLERGANPNFVETKHFLTPLSVAILNKNEVLVRALLAKKADVRQRLLDGRSTMLALARKRKEWKVVRLVKLAGARE